MTVLDHLPHDLEAVATHVRAAQRAFGAADNKLNLLRSKDAAIKAQAAVRGTASRYAEAIVEAEMNHALGQPNPETAGELERLKGSLQNAKREHEMLEPLITAYTKERNRRHRDLVDAVERFTATCARHERVIGAAAAEFAASRSISLDGDDDQLLAVKLAIAADIDLDLADYIVATSQPLAEVKAA